MKYKRGDIVRLDVIEDSFYKADTLRGIVIQTQPNKNPDEPTSPLYFILWESTPSPEWVYEDALVPAYPHCYTNEI